LEFVSADADGNLCVKFVNKTSAPLMLNAIECDLSDSLRVTSIDPSEKTLPFLWRKHLSAGSHFGKEITIAPQGSADCKFNIYGGDWLPGQRSADSFNRPAKLTLEILSQKLFKGDEVMIIYQGSYRQTNQTPYSGPLVTLLCYGKVNNAAKSKSN